jgi:outer membrane protein insertion porin family
VSFWFLPKDIGLKGAIHADAGSLWDYHGPTQWAATGEANGIVNGHFCDCGMVYDDPNVIRSSVGVGLIGRVLECTWSSDLL